MEVDLLLWVVTAWFRQVYEERPRAGLRSMVRVGRTLAVLALAPFGIATFGHRFRANLGLVVAYLVVTLALIGANRAAFRLMAQAARRRCLSARR